MSEVEYSASNELVREIEAERENIQAQIHAALAEIKAVNKERRKVPSVGPINPNFKGLHSCRYADDFLIGVIGSRAMAESG